MDGAEESPFGTSTVGSENGAVVGNMEGDSLGMNDETLLRDGEAEGDSLGASLDALLGACVMLFMVAVGNMLRTFDSLVGDVDGWVEGESLGAVVLFNVRDGSTLGVLVLVGDIDDSMEGGLVGTCVASTGTPVGESEMGGSARFCTRKLQTPGS
ncbi:MAG: hypothetical protein SGBAC_011932, partial [Bacillariaceae sp.]